MPRRHFPEEGTKAVKEIYLKTQKTKDGQTLLPQEPRACCDCSFIGANKTLRPETPLF